MVFDKENLLKFYKAVAVPVLLYSSENWRFTKSQLKGTKSAEKSESHILPYVIGIY